MEYRGVFMSFNEMVLRLGQTLGLLLTRIFFHLWGTTGAFFMGATIALMTAVF